MLLFSIGGQPLSAASLGCLRIPVKPRRPPASSWGSFGQCPPLSTASHPPLPLTLLCFPSLLLCTPSSDHTATSQTKNFTSHLVVTVRSSNCPRSQRKPKRHITYLVAFSAYCDMSYGNGPRLLCYQGRKQSMSKAWMKKKKSRRKDAAPFGEGRLLPSFWSRSPAGVNKKVLGWFT